MPEPVIFPGHESKLVGVTRRVTRLERRPLPYVILDHFKIWGDRTVTKVQNPAFQWTVSDDITDAGLDVIAVRGYVTTTGGAVGLQLWNVTENELIVSWTIAAGAKSAYEADGVDECMNYLNVDLDADEDEQQPELKLVTTSHGSTKGLGIYVFYGHDRRP
jgi:hypothetical protein